MAFVKAWIKSKFQNGTTGLKKPRKYCTKIKPVVLTGILLSSLLQFFPLIYSLVAKIPAGLIDVVSVRFPIVLKRLIKLLGQKVQQSWAKSDAPGGAVGSGMLGGAGAAAAADGMPGIFSTLLIFTGF